MKWIAAGILMAGLVEPGRAAAGQQASDSLAILEDARSAQAAFERTRVARLPWTLERAVAGEGEIIGRFRVTDGGDDWTPPPEPPAVAAAREELLEMLARSAVALPGDGWIAGQRVRYLVEAGRPSTALAAARACRAEPWWCRALAGCTLHAARDFESAAAEFDAALAAMPAPERERWTDLSPLLEGSAARAYRELDAGPRAAFARRFWWLADPLWSLAGNDRWTEHLVRHAMGMILRDARTAFEVGWGGDLQEITIRYGWPAGWERVRSRSGSLGSGAGYGIIGRDPPGERHFLPPFDAILDPAAVLPGDWPLDDEGTQATYAPSYTRRFLDLDHQLAVFRRGSSAVVVAGYALPPDSIPASARVEAALVVAADPDARPDLARSGASAATGSIVLEVPWAAAIVSMEAFAPEAGVAGRARYGLPVSGAAADRPAVSDLLLLTGSTPLPDSLSEAILRARGSARVASGEEVGVYWEVYPPAGGPHEARFALKLRDERGGFWRGLRAVLGLRDRNGDGVALEWTEPLPASIAAFPRAVAVKLPDLAPGDYALDLEVRFGGFAPARATRPVTVTR